MDDYLTSLAEEQPKAIIVQDGYYQHEYYGKFIQEFLKENNYTLVWQEKDDIESGGALVFYHE